MNLLFIFSDQQHRDSLGCMGHTTAVTPRLDALADTGVLCRNAYSCNPVCTPYRLSLMTGRYGSRIPGGHLNQTGLPTRVPTMAQAMEAAGVHTSYVGKWHLGDTGHGPIPEAQRGGFRDFIGYQCYNGFTTNTRFCDEANIEHCFEQHRTEVTTDLAVERLGHLNNKRFAMFVSYQAPHYPVQPSSRFADLHAGKPVQSRPNRQDVAPYTPTMSPPSPKPPEHDPDYQRYGNDLDEYIRLYDAMCSQVDAGVGRLLDQLNTLGLTEDTVVIYTSDHGDMQGSHGLINKQHPYEESAGVPLIVRWPGGLCGETVDTPIGSIDLTATCLDAVGADSLTDSDGETLRPIFTEQSDQVGRPVFSERPNWCLVRRGDWKLVASREDHEPGDLRPTHLFNLAEDRYELNDRLGDETASEAEFTLLDVLREWDHRVRAPRGAVEA